MLRFQVSADDAAKFATRGALAAKALFELEESAEHYRSLWESIGDQLPKVEPPPGVDVDAITSRSNAQREQWWALRRDLTELVADSYDAGTDNLRKLKPMVAPKTDRTLSAPDPTNRMEVGLTAFVMADHQLRLIVKARDELLRIVERMEAADDPAINDLGGRVRAFVDETEDQAEWVERRRRAAP